jgi:hypothetical protein
VRLDLRHRRLQRGVVGLAADRALDLVGAVAGLAEHAAEDVAAARKRLPAVPTIEAWKPDMYPFRHLSQ